MVDGGVFVVCVFFARKYTFLAQIELFKNILKLVYRKKDLFNLLNNYGEMPFTCHELSVHTNPPQGKICSRPQTASRPGVE